jgi:hypothetical protein
MPRAGQPWVIRFIHQKNQMNNSKSTKYGGWFTFEVDKNHNCVLLYDYETKFWIFLRIMSSKFQSRFEQCHTGTNNKEEKQ